jgi:hypothetical protein
MRNLGLSGIRAIARGWIFAGVQAGLFAGSLALAILPAGAQSTGSAPPRPEPPTRETGVPVDVELVLAVDVSFSMDLDEQKLQREGYAEALRAPEVIKAITDNMIGSIALTYVEWAGVGTPKVLVPWRLIDGPAAAHAFADELERLPTQRLRRTSISTAIDFSMPLFEASGFQGMRRVIDVSGDGPNNQGRMVTDARDAAIAKGIVINGLPLMLKRPNWLDVPDLDVYYVDCVIGGPGSFSIPVRDMSQFPSAIRSKIILEVGQGPHDPAAMPPIRMAADEGAPRSDCLIGEKLWQERMERN